ncbi:MAG: hypothetical protein FJ221_04875 [Lentisphaerae bacterium]|nr:hypothetical protein [Lentisphaerota bacterium]
MRMRVAMAVLAVAAFAVPAAWTGEDKPKESAGGFAGMIAGKVLSKDGGKLVVEVTGVEKTWKHNKMENPGSLVGREVVILPSKKAKNVARLAEMLKPGDTESFDVRQDGKLMVWLELTGPQRERVGDGEKKR